MSLRPLNNFGLARIEWNHQTVFADNVSVKVASFLVARSSCMMIMNVWSNQQVEQNLLCIFAMARGIGVF